VPLLPDALVRLRATAPQTQLCHEERRTNVLGAFVINGTCAAGLAGKRLLLIDDVSTTGSTLGADGAGAHESSVRRRYD
jgi:predicted amidophosphoribosyltransferase